VINMSSQTAAPTVFLSYASQDRERVLEFYDYLASAGFDVWLDVKRIRPGQPWDFEIRKALETASTIVVFISNNSVGKRGYVQKEIRLALNKLDEKVLGDIYVIPVRLDENAPIPPQLSGIHVVTGEDQACKESVAQSIRHAFEQQGIQITKAQEDANISWSLHKYKDEWDGLPGYRIDFDWYALRSDHYSNMSDISDMMKGELIQLAGNWRLVKFSQSPDFYNFGEDRERRQNSWEANSSPPIIQGRVISFEYSVWWYGAKAAHPNFGFMTLCFLIDPVARIDTLERIFASAEEALPIVQSEIRRTLVGPSGEVDKDYPLDAEWVEKGTASWRDLNAFTFGKDAILFSFGAYSVAPYAWGPQSATVAYEKIVHLITPEFRSALDLYYSCTSTRPTHDGAPDQPDAVDNNPPLVENSNDTDPPGDAGMPERGH
jgi:hypothetical protein